MVLKLLCAWCGLVLREGTSGADTSHGICRNCFTRVVEKAA